MSKEMNDKLLCPFCGEELDTENYYVRCRNPYCNETVEMDGTEEIWQALIQSQRDLQDKKEELEEFKKHHAMWEQIRNNTILALEKDLQIAKQMLEETKKLITKFYNSHPTITVYQVLTGINSFATQALTQITHDNKD